MSTSDELSDLDPIDEELVAYLDGELEPGHRARVERRLAEDADYRDRLRRLQQSWDALDLLSRATADDAFTSTTVGMVAAQQQEEATRAIRTFVARRSRRWLWIGAAGAAAAVLGFFLVYQRLTEGDRELVTDLPVIERVDQLHNTPSVDFLEQLREERLFLADSNEN